jgi:hypothetical protein
MSYFDEVEAEVRQTFERFTADEAALAHLAELEGEVWKVVSLCTGDREFPDDVRQEALAFAACETVREIAPGIAPSADVIWRAMRDGYSPMIAKLRRLFLGLESRKVQTRFGLLSADPRENAARRDAHDLAKFRPFAVRKES